MSKFDFISLITILLIVSAVSVTASAAVSELYSYLPEGDYTNNFGFVPADEYYVDAGVNVDPTHPGSWGVECWVNLDSVGIGDEMTMVGVGHEYGSPKIVRLELWDPDGGGANYRVTCMHPGAFGFYGTTNMSNEIGNWIHIAFVFDGGSPFIYVGTDPGGAVISEALGSPWGVPAPGAISVDPSSGVCTGAAQWTSNASQVLLGCDAQILGTRVFEFTAGQFEPGSSLLPFVSCQTYDPEPRDDTEVSFGVDVRLNWNIVGDPCCGSIVEYHVYLDPNEELLETRGDRGTTTNNYMTIDASELTNNTKYFWRVDAVYDTGTVEGLVWSFTTIPPVAGNPDPEDGSEMSEETALGNPVLSWSPGATAVHHDVYFGTNYNDVNDANTSTPVIYKDRQDPCSYEPGALNLGETYYWRIDEVESGGAPIYKGDIWQFTVELIGDFSDDGMVNIDDLAILVGEWLMTTTVGNSWENDMSVDPVGNGWVVRGTADDYTISGGLMNINAGAFGTLVDSVPYDEFVGRTDIELIWRATSMTNPGLPVGSGVGLWMNVVNSDSDYGNINFQAILVDGSSQQVEIHNKNTMLLIIDGFDNSMLDMTATIDTDAMTITYEVTDGTTTKNGVVSYVTTDGQPNQAATIFTAGAAGEIDYLRIASIIPLVPIADTDGNDFVNFYDFAKMASQWLVGTE